MPDRAGSCVCRLGRSRQLSFNNAPRLTDVGSAVVTLFDAAPHWVGCRGMDCGGLGSEMYQIAEYYSLDAAVTLVCE